jgi:hypothetical protein
MPDFNDSIGYASYQQQYNSTSTTGYQSNDNGSIVLFFSIIFVIFISFVFYFWYTERHKVPIDQRGDQSVDQQQEIYLLVDNLSNQLKIVFKLPLISLAIVLWNRIFTSRHQKQQQLELQIQQQQQQQQQQQDMQVIPLASHEHQRVDDTKYYHLFSLLFIVAFTIALAILVGTLSSPSNASSSSSTLLQSALFILVLCINLYLITRQRCYYMHRRKLYEDDEHISAIYDTRFSDWDPKILSNWIQILILVIEFFQLMTFPLRDLITIFNKQRTEDHTELVSFILTAGGLMPDMRTPSWYTYSLWTCFAGTLFSLVLALFIHCVNLKYPYKFPTRWVRWCIPVAVSYSVSFYF